MFPDRPRLARWLSGALGLLLTLSQGGCASRGPAQPALRISMIPTTDPARALRESQPLVDHLGRRTGLRVELTVPTNYAAVVEALVNGQVDVAYLGGFTYVQASARGGAVPLVQRERDQDFHSVFVTQPGSPIRGLGDLAGHTFAFGDVNSTSGHLMPEYDLRQAKVDPQVIARALYTGGHDATLLAVANGKVDAGALDEAVFQRMTSEGKVPADRVRVFHRTAPFFDYVWAARKDLDPAVQQAFSRALLDLDPSRPQDKTLLELLSASRYVKAEDASYGRLRQVAREAGLLK